MLDDPRIQAIIVGMLILPAGLFAATVIDGVLATTSTEDGGGFAFALVGIVRDLAPYTFRAAIWALSVGIIVAGALGFIGRGPLAR